MLLIFLGETQVPYFVPMIMDAVPSLDDGSMRDIFSGLIHTVELGLASTPFYVYGTNKIRGRPSEDLAERVDRYTSHFYTATGVGALLVGLQHTEKVKSYMEPLVNALGYG